MAPAAATTSSSGRAVGGKAAAAGGRVTRLRAAKEQTASPAAGKPPGLLARGFRTVSDKMKEKEREREKKASSGPEAGVYSESLQAFLRIRPPPHDGELRGRPYLEPQGEKEVLMRAPTDPTRPTIPKPPHIYSFDRVFTSTSSQATFFSNTTLPLVDKLLKGENGLLFAYGVSNSGKTYSISGGQSASADDRGVLPRAIDVVFNSIKGLESKAHLRCTGLADVTLAGSDEHAGILDCLPVESEGRIDESCKVDRNFSYAVFMSYAEVYNEKIFDLLESVLPLRPTGGGPPRPAGAMKRSASNMGLHGGAVYGSSLALAAMANGGAGVIKRHALSLKNDPEGNGKYIAGLNEIRVRTREEALSVLRSGQRARQVFGTLANRESSRSHGIFTIKVVRVHNGAPEDPDSAQVSRLAIVDLAGSERTKNTQTTGDRLKEAGNINKSLMVLGQCLEVLRSNQQKMSAPAPPGSKRKLAVVPFRHSKLTEIFQNFFVGDGHAVMMVHVNPYDTGFDENSHVMRFSAIAREVQTTAQNKVGFPLLKRQISTQFSALKHAVSGPMKIKVVVPVLPTTVEGKSKAKLAMARESDGFVMVEQELEVVEEDEEDDSEDEKDWLVEHLFEQLKEYKTMLYESEMRNAAIEVGIREEVAQEMQQQLQKMQVDFAKRFQDQMAASELKTDRKLDILSRTMTPATERFRQPQQQQDEDDSDISRADLSMEASTLDESFESAIDTSLVESDWQAKTAAGRISDPFVVTPLVRNSSPGAHTTEDDESDVTQTEADQSLVDQSVGIIVDSVPADPPREARGSREATGESDDLAAAPMEADDHHAPGTVSMSRSKGAASETEEEEEEEEEEEVEESDDDDGARDGRDIDNDVSDEDFDGENSIDPYGEEASETETEEDEVESSFEASESEPESEPSPPRRTSKWRPSNAGTNRAGISLEPKPVQTPARQTKPKGKRVVDSPVSSKASPSILGESRSQEKVPDEDDDDVVLVTATAKKKRTLGKKVVTEEDMERADVPIGTKNVRRLVNSSSTFFA